VIRLAGLLEVLVALLADRLNSGWEGFGGGLTLLLAALLGLGDGAHVMFSWASRTLLVRSSSNWSSLASNWCLTQSLCCSTWCSASARALRIGTAWRMTWGRAIVPKPRSAPMPAPTATTAPTTQATVQPSGVKAPRVLLGDLGIARLRIALIGLGDPLPRPGGFRLDGRRESLAHQWFDNGFLGTVGRAAHRADGSIAAAATTIGGMNDIS
jgi:hypothetical protein